MNQLKIVLLISLTLCIFQNVYPSEPDKNVVNQYYEFKSYGYKDKFLKTVKTNYFHGDSAHNLNLRYSDRQRGIKPYIAPILLIGEGTALHFMTDIKENFRDYTQKHFPYEGHIDDYIQYAPLVAVYAFNAFGLKGKNNFGNRTAIAVKSVVVNYILVYPLKKISRVNRPNGGIYSFPSGHTSFAFAMAHFLNKEFGHRSKWYSVAAYTTATSVGLMRITRDEHWISDVLVGAGIGMFSTELIYLTHQYKWDNKHLKTLDIFPFKTKHQNGISLVYRF